MYPPIPPDPEPVQCEADGLGSSGCWNEAETQIGDTWLCDEHADDHYRSEEADRAIKAQKENPT